MSQEHISNRTLSDDDVMAIATALREMLKPSVLKPIKKEFQEKLFISQNRAWKIYFKSNVEAWKNAGLIEAYKRKNRIEYEVAQLEKASKLKQIIPCSKKIRK